MIKKMLKGVIAFIRSNKRLKASLKRFTIRHPKLTAGLLKVYRRNIPVVKLEENMDRLAEEEIETLSLEANRIFERLNER